MGKMLKVLFVMGGIILVVVMAARPSREEVQETMGEIQRSVADEEVAKYEMVFRHGSKMERCVQAGMVAAAFLQAKREAEYAVWAKVEKKDCKRAGL